MELSRGFFDPHDAPLDLAGGQQQARGAFGDGPRPRQRFPMPAGSSGAVAAATAAKRDTGVQCSGALGAAPARPNASNTTTCSLLKDLVNLLKEGAQRSGAIGLHASLCTLNQLLDLLVATLADLSADLQGAGSDNPEAARLLSEVMTLDVGLTQVATQLAAFTPGGKVVPPSPATVLAATKALALALHRLSWCAGNWKAEKVHARRAAAHSSPPHAAITVPSPRAAIIAPAPSSQHNSEDGAPVTPPGADVWSQQAAMDPSAETFCSDPTPAAAEHDLAAAAELPAPALFDGAPTTHQVCISHASAHTTTPLTTSIAAPALAAQHSSKDGAPIMPIGGITNQHQQATDSGAPSPTAAKGGAASATELPPPVKEESGTGSQQVCVPRGSRLGRWLAPPSMPAGAQQGQQGQQQVQAQDDEDKKEQEQQLHGKQQLLVQDDEERAEEEQQAQGQQQQGLQGDHEAMEQHQQLHGQQQQEEEERDVVGGEDQQLLQGHQQEHKEGQQQQQQLCGDQQQQQEVHDGAQEQDGDQQQQQEVHGVLEQREQEAHGEQQHEQGQDQQEVLDGAQEQQAAPLEEHQGKVWQCWCRPQSGFARGWHQARQLGMMVLMVQRGDY